MGVPPPKSQPRLNCICNSPSDGKIAHAALMSRIVCPALQGCFVGNNPSAGQLQSTSSSRDMDDIILCEKPEKRMKCGFQGHQNQSKLIFFSFCVHSFLLPTLDSRVIRLLWSLTFYRGL